MDHREQAERCLIVALNERTGHGRDVQISAAQVHAILYLADRVNALVEYFNDSMAHGVITVVPR